MQLESLLRKRAMIRAFAQDPVDEEKVWKILRNAWRSPSAGHLEPQDFLVVRDGGLKKRLAEAALGQSFIEQAPVVIVVCCDTRRNVGRYGERRGPSIASSTAPSPPSSFCSRPSSLAWEPALWGLSMMTRWRGSWRYRRR